jgi:hypothetical protein
MNGGGDAKSRLKYKPPSIISQAKITCNSSKGYCSKYSVNMVHLEDTFLIVHVDTLIMMTIINMQLLIYSYYSITHHSCKVLGYPLEQL